MGLMTGVDMAHRRVSTNAVHLAFAPPAHRAIRQRITKALLTGGRASQDGLPHAEERGEEAYIHGGVAWPIADENALVFHAGWIALEGRYGTPGGGGKTVSGRSLGPTR